MWIWIKSEDPESLVDLQDGDVGRVQGVDIQPAGHIRPEVDLVLLPVTSLLPIIKISSPAAYLSEGPVVPSLGSDHIPSSKEGAPQTERAVGEDGMLTGGENTQIEPNQILLIHQPPTEVWPKHHVRMFC